MKNLTVKYYTDLLLVDIYYIRAVGFYQTLIKLETKPFVTSITNSVNQSINYI